MARLRLILDSNVWISGVLWTGLPHRIVRLIERDEAQAFASTPMLDELREALARPKFAARFDQLASSPSEVMAAVAGLVTLVAESRIEPVIRRDPDDDKVLACAVSADADFVISGDRHLLELLSYRGIRVVTPALFWREKSNSVRH